MVRPKVEAARMSRAWWNTRRRYESLARSRAIGTGIGPWPSISQHSPGAALPRRRASRSTRTRTLHRGGRVTIGCSAAPLPLLFFDVAGPEEAIAGEQIGLPAVDLRLEGE